MNDTNTSSLTGLASVLPSFFGPPVLYSDPQDVLSAVELGIAEKREILSSWASDARAVPDAPSLRLMDNGQIVAIQDILDALKTLDVMELASGNAKLRTLPPRRRNPSGQWLPPTLRPHRWDDDDDDPPPCPAVISPLTRDPTSGAVNALEAA